MSAFGPDCIKSLNSTIVKNWMQYLDNKAVDINDARCNHEDSFICFYWRTIHCIYRNLRFCNYSGL